MAPLLFFSPNKFHLLMYLPTFVKRVVNRFVKIPHILRHWRIIATSAVYHRRKQALGHQAYLVHVSSHVESWQSSRRSNGLETSEREKRGRDKYKGPARFATWLPAVRLWGTVSARKHKASPFSHSLSFSPYL